MSHSMFLSTFVRKLTRPLAFTFLLALAIPACMPTQPADAPSSDRLDRFDRPGRSRVNFR